MRENKHISRLREHVGMGTTRITMAGFADSLDLAAILSSYDKLHGIVKALQVPSETMEDAVHETILDHLGQHVSVRPNMANKVIRIVLAAAENEVLKHN